MQKMGNLKSGASYIYERANGITYAREVGSIERTVIGWDYIPDKPSDGKEIYLETKERILWKQIREAAKTNIALQNAIENVKIMYHLSKSNGTK